MPLSKEIQEHTSHRRLLINFKETLVNHCGICYPQKEETWSCEPSHEWLINQNQPKKQITFLKEHKLYQIRLDKI